MRIKNERLKFDIQLFADGEISYKVTIDNNGAIKSLEKVEDKANKLSSKFTSFGTKMTVGVTAPLTALATAGVKYNATMETYLANLTTLLGGNQQEAQKLLDTLKEMANTTPYEATDLVKATQKMMAFGISAGDSLKYLNMLGDIAMGDANKMDSLTLAFSQISASGRASMEDINQMIDQGFNPLTIVAQKTGESMSDLRDRVSAGGVSFEEIAGAFETATSEGGTFYQSMDKASQTTEGKISSLKDAFSSALGSMTESLLPFVTEAVEGLTKVADWFANLDENGKRTVLTLAGIAMAIGPVSSAIGGLMKIGEGISKLSKHVTTLKNGFTAFSGVISKGATGLKSFATSIGTLAINFGKLALQTALSTAKLIAQKVAMVASTVATNAMAAAQWLLNIAMNANPITLIIIAIVALIAIIVTLWNKCEWFREGVMTVINAIWGAIQSVGTFIMGVFQNVFNFVSGIFTSLWNVIQTVVNTIVSIFSTAWNTIKSVATTVWNGILGLFSAGGKIFTGVVEGIAGVFKTIVNAIIKGINKVIRIPFDTINGILNFIRNTNILGFSPFLGLWGQNPLPVPQIPTLNVGTNYVEGEGLAYLHEGEAVVPKKYNPAVGGFGNYNQPIYVNVVADMDVDKFGKAFVRDIKTFSGGTKNSYNYGGGR